jgi:hypothetical protein
VPNYSLFFVLGCATKWALGSGVSRHRARKNKTRDPIAGSLITIAILRAKHFLPRSLRARVAADPGACAPPATAPPQSERGKKCGKRLLA